MEYLMILCVSVCVCGSKIKYSAFAQIFIVTKGMSNTLAKQSGKTIVFNFIAGSFHLWKIQMKIAQIYLDGQARLVEHFYGFSIRTVARMQIAETIGPHTLAHKCKYLQSHWQLIQLHN